MTVTTENHDPNWSAYDGPLPAADVILRQPNVHGAIAQVMRMVGAVAKDQRNQQQNFDYRGIDQIYNAVQPAMAAVGLVIFMQKITSLEYRDVLVGVKKTPAVSVKVKATFKMVGPDGSEDYGEMVGEAVDYGDKATSKAITMTEKSFVLTLLKIPTQERDPDGTSYELAEPDGRTYGAEPAEDRPRGWKELYDDAVIHGINAVHDFLVYAREQEAPEIVISHTETTLAEMRAQEQKDHDTRTAGTERPKLTDQEERSMHENTRAAVQGAWHEGQDGGGQVGNE